MRGEEGERTSGWLKLFSAGYYCLASMTVHFANKVICRSLPSSSFIPCRLVYPIYRNDSLVPALKNFAGSILLTMRLADLHSSFMTFGRLILSGGQLSCKVYVFVSSPEFTCCWICLCSVDVAKAEVLTSLLVLDFANMVYSLFVSTTSLPGQVCVRCLHLLSRRVNVDGASCAKNSK